jgi:hypothetical protein
LHPSSGAQLQRTAIGFVWVGVFIPLEQVLVLGHLNTSARSVTDLNKTFKKIKVKERVGGKSE